MVSGRFSDGDDRSQQLLASSSNGWIYLVSDELAVRPLVQCRRVVRHMELLRGSSVDIAICAGEFAGFFAVMNGKVCRMHSPGACLCGCGAGNIRGRVLGLGCWVELYF